MKSKPLRDIKTYITAEPTRQLGNTKLETGQMAKITGQLRANWPKFSPQIACANNSSVEQITGQLHGCNSRVKNQCRLQRELHPTGELPLQLLSYTPCICPVTNGRVCSAKPIPMDLNKNAWLLNQFKKVALWYTEGLWDSGACMPSRSCKANGKCENDSLTPEKEKEGTNVSAAASQFHFSLKMIDSIGERLGRLDIQNQTEKER